MENKSVTILIIAGLAALLLVIFLIWKNLRDKKLLNPDSPDSVDETHNDSDRKADRT